jgi:hypothetical protein
MTALIKVSFLAWEMNFSFRPSNFLQTLPWIPAKVVFIDQPTKARSPKYFSKLAAAEIPTMELMYSRNSYMVFLLKKMEVFSLFNFCPKAFL